MRDDSAVLHAIERAIGPAPWYWKTFQPIIGSSGREFVWRLMEQANGRRYVCLERDAQVVFVVNVHTRAFTILPGLLGVWFPHLSSGPRGRVTEVRVFCFDPEKLASIKSSLLPDSHIQYASGDGLLSEFSISVELPAGQNTVMIPAEFDSLSELLVVADHIGDDSPSAIYAVHPALNQIEVFPQQWFRNFQRGYEWIARVTRHPESGVFIGDGVRIDKFELTADGRHLARWIS